MKALFVLGRVVFGGFFLYNGINHILNKEAMTGFVASKQLPLPDYGVVGSGALMMAAGLATMVGLKTGLAGTALASFLTVVSPLFHDFWNEKDGMAAQNQMTHFSKNMALLAAALILAGVEERQAES